MRLEAIGDLALGERTIGWKNAKKMQIECWKSVKKCVFFVGKVYFSDFICLINRKLLSLQKIL